MIPNVKSFEFASRLKTEQCHFTQYMNSKSAKDRIHFILMHGALEHTNRHSPLISFLLDAFPKNVVISSLDLVGHGKSTGQRGYVDSFETYIQDYLSFFELATKSVASKSIYLIGHSLGGMITLSALERIKNPINGIMLSNPCISPMLKIPSIISSIFNALPKDVGSIKVPNSYSGADLTRDHARQINFDDDALIPKKISLAMGNAILEQADKMNSLAYFIDTPCLILLSGNDVVVDVHATKRFMKSMPKDKLSVLEFEEAKHELFNEINRLEVFEQLKEFVHKLEEVK